MKNTYPADLAPQQSYDGTGFYITLGGTIRNRFKSKAKAMAAAIRHQAECQKWAKIN